MFKVYSEKKKLINCNVYKIKFNGENYNNGMIRIDKYNFVIYADHKEILITPRFKLRIKKFITNINLKNSEILINKDRKIINVKNENNIFLYFDESYKLANFLKLLISKMKKH